MCAGCLIGKQIRDLPVLCWDKARFVGDRVAAVAAETVDAAEEAIQLIDVDYEILPAVFDPLEAMAPGAPLLHDNVAEYDGAPKNILAADLRNGLTRLAWKKGDIEQGFRDADLVFEHTFNVPARHQGYLEPHAATVAIEPDGRVQVWASVKNPFGVRSQLSKCLGLAEERIRMNVVNVGGEFGGKGDGVDLPILYFLAQKTGRPVKFIMTYAEELSASNPAHPTVITIKSGVMRDGAHRRAQMRAAPRQRRLRRAQVQYLVGDLALRRRPVSHRARRHRVHADLYQYRARRLLPQSRRGGDGVRRRLPHRHHRQRIGHGCGRVSPKEFSQRRRSRRGRSRIERRALS